MKVRSLVFVIMSVVLTACHPSTPAPVAVAAERHFSLVVEHSQSSGWAARCDEGCRWKKVAMACGGCDVRLDIAGISGVQAPQDKVDGFELIVSRTRDGIAARSVSGAKWKALSWKCEQATCTARIDESGVGG